MPRLYSFAALGSESPEPTQAPENSQAREWTPCGKKLRRYETPEFHTSQNLAEERFVMGYLQGSDKEENAAVSMNTE
jgi:hypothetical protein